MRLHGFFKSCFSVIFFTSFLSSCLKDNSGPSFEVQLMRDLAIIDAYLEENSIEAEIDPSGLRYVIHINGSGAQPTLQQCVTFDFSAKLLTGTIFESGENAKSPLYFLIDGLKIGLPLISEGGSITLFIPSVYAYGRSGNPPQIPGNANLIFDVQLFNVTNVNPNTGLCN